MILIYFFKYLFYFLTELMIEYGSNVIIKFINYYYYSYTT